MKYQHLTEAKGESPVDPKVGAHQIFLSAELFPPDPPCGTRFLWEEGLFPWSLLAQDMWSCCK